MVQIIEGPIRPSSRPDKRFMREVRKVTKDGTLLKKKTVYFGTPQDDGGKAQRKK